MRSMFYVLSDDHLGSTPQFAPGSQVQPSAAAAVANEADDVVVDMEVTASNNSASGSKATGGGLSQQLKRKSGDLFSGSSKQRVLSQDQVPESFR